jgi:CAI-1 autoinducer synthase
MPASPAVQSLLSAVTTGEARPLPEFAARRLAAYQERKRSNWNGRNIMLGKRVTDDDLVLTSNDYLAIGRHPDIIAAEIDALRRHGNGSMMSAVFMQDDENPQRRLEALFAASLGAEAAVLAQSGWCANVGLIQSVADERTPVYIDHFAHASLWEGVKSAGARGIAVHHNDTEHLERQILRYGPGLIVVDAVYSTTGSLCPVHEYARISRELGCMLLVDESHSLGTHGEFGEGIVASSGLTDDVDFVTASLAKAYIGRAGLITCRAAFKEFLTGESLPAIFSSTLLPHDLAGLEAAHAVIRSEGWRRDRLWAITRRVREGLDAAGYPLGNGSEQIIGLEIGLEADTMQVRDVCEQHGIVGSIFCAPATPAKRSLLRLTLNAGMSDETVERLIATLRRIRAQARLQDWTARRREERLAGPVLERSAA